MNAERILICRIPGVARRSGWGKPKQWARGGGASAARRSNSSSGVRQCGPPAPGARFRRLVDEALAVELAQPVQGERWVDAVPEQPLAPGAVDGDAAAMLPLPHRLRVIARQQAAAHEHAQQPPAHACPHVGDGVGLSTQIARISGHRDPRMLRRYMSLRGSELAQHLW